ncbi:uncharacterized protein LOC133124244 isoform X3 [Conger conger]|uniref:uncharacterized protein LOC133124244 isoform X3 n=1 Tax=Conger conger TaxID=82655 RepID=UPI002A5A9156|nr:uncharacterized protein LOC133124244 isoform X3 [Conger conger]
MGMVLWWTLLWILRYCHILSAEVLVQHKYFIYGEDQGVSLQAPTEPKGKEFIWEWTSHDGRYTNARIITMQSNEKCSWNLNGAHISKQGKYDLSLKPEVENAGVFTFIQTKPEKVHLAQIEVFAIEVKPSHWHTEREGSDVTMSCELSHLPDSATLAWERDREPTANTTLIYNNTAHIIIHSVDQHTTYDIRHTLYRGSLNSSEAVLISHSLSSYTKASWSWVPVSETQAIHVASAVKNENASISTKMDKERFSSDVYDGSKFPLKISPVKFGDSGSYTCFYDNTRMATINLVTIQVSAEPPGGLSRNQSVVLNCEISQVIGTVTLAWLRMKGGRGELVKQEVLTKRPPKTMLSLTLPSLTEDQLHWACVVFTGSVLRAQVPLHLTLPKTPITDPEKSEEDDGRRLVIILACSAAVCVGLLLLLCGGLLSRRLKRATAVGGNGDSSAADNVYSNVAEIQNDQANPGTATEENESEELQYLVFSQTAPSHNPHRQRQDRSGQDENDKVVYASICKT